MSLNVNQLRATLANGDENVDNVLILKTDGNFQLVQGATCLAVKGMEYVTRWSTYDAQSGWVGQGAAEDNTHINNIMGWANIAWQKYKTTGQTQITNLWD